MIVFGLFAKKGIATVRASHLGDPQVGGSCIENDSKGLWGSTNRDGTVVLGVAVIVNDFRLGRAAAEVGLVGVEDGVNKDVVVVFDERNLVDLGSSRGSE